MEAKRKLSDVIPSDISDENHRKLTKMNEDIDNDQRENGAEVVLKDTNSTEGSQVGNFSGHSNSKDKKSEEKAEVSESTQNSDTAQKPVAASPEMTNDCNKPVFTSVFGSAAKTIVTFATLRPKGEESDGLFGGEASQAVVESSGDGESLLATENFAPETGEEEEMTICSSKAKLFEMNVDSKEWIEKGLGTVKLNHIPADDRYSRIIMRADGVPRVLLNLRIFPELKFELVQNKNVRFSDIKEGIVHHYLLRFRNSNDALDFTVHLEAQVELSK